MPPDTVPEKGTLLIRVARWQYQWFGEKVARWPEGKKLEVVTESYQHIEEVPEILRAKRHPKAGGAFLVVKVEGRMLPILIEEKLLLPIDSLVSSAEVERLRGTFVAESFDPAVRGGHVWALPRKIENHIFVFRSDFVRRASLYWASMREELEEVFRRENGHGLPAGYQLESDPVRWDSYDMAVAGYYWSRTRLRGATGPRLGHRTRDYPGTYVDMAARLFALGGTPEELVGLQGPAVVDFLTWEAFFFRYGIYPETMLEPGWFGGDMYKGFEEYSLLATTMHQLDAFQFKKSYAVDEAGKEGVVSWTLVPLGVSLAVDKTGRPQRTGQRRSHMAGWWWGIPADCPCPRLSLELIQYLTSRDVHLEECKSFGIYPIRQELWKQPEKSFQREWLRTMFDVSRAQFAKGCPVIPDDRIRNRKEALRLFDLWRRVVTHPSIKDLSVPLEKLKIADMVEANHGP